MAALTKSRYVFERRGNVFETPVAASTKIYKGAAVLVNASGYAVNAAASVSGEPLGVALETVDNSAGAAGDLNVKTISGLFEFVNSGTDAIDAADREQIVYFEDNQTVRAGSSAGTYPAAGRMKGLSANSLVVVAVGPLHPVDGDLVAANNLSDVGSAATSRSNLGLTNDATGRGNLGIKEAIHGDKISAVAADAEVYRFVATRAGTITKIWTVLNLALTTGDCTVTAAIDGTPVTGGVVTITQSGSAAGDVDSATPSAANTFTAGQVITLTVGGTNDAAGSTFNAALELSY